MENSLLAIFDEIWPMTLYYNQEYIRKGECLTALCCLLHVCVEYSGSFVSTPLCPVTRFAKSNYLGCNLITYCHAVPHVDIDNDGVIV